MQAGVAGKVWPVPVGKSRKLAHMVQMEATLVMGGLVSVGKRLNLDQAIQRARDDNPMHMPKPSPVHPDGSQVLSGESKALGESNRPTQGLQNWNPNQESRTVMLPDETGEMKVVATKHGEISQWMQMEHHASVQKGVSHGALDAAFCVDFFSQVCLGHIDDNSLVNFKLNNFLRGVKVPKNVSKEQEEQVVEFFSDILFDFV